MKHTTHNITFAIGIAVMAATTLFAATKATAQDIYQIEQEVEESLFGIHIEEGWDVHLIQAPQGSPTTVVLSTSCAEFFVDGNEPKVFNVKCFGKYACDLFIDENKSMPRNTLIEIHTAQSIKHIRLYKNARLTIEQYDFDSVKLDINADSGAILIIDTMHNLSNTSISLHDASLDLRRFKGSNLHIWAHGNSSVNKSKLWAKNQWLNLSENAVCNVTTTDSARQLYVKRKRWLNHGDKINRLTLTFGMETGFPIAGTNGARQGSPYNTGIEISGHLLFRTEQIPLGGRWGCDLGLLGSYRITTLDNVVKASGTNSLVLDASHGATPPRQTLLYWTIGLPVSVRYNLPQSYRPWFKGFHATLMPIVNFKQSLRTQTLGSNNRWGSTDDKHLDLLNRFNVRAEVGVDMGFFGLNSVDFFIDLLPSYKASANAPQTRMMGLVYHF